MGAIVTLVALSGCLGFKPLYGEYGAVAAAPARLAAVDIQPIPGREGQILRNALLDCVTPRGVPGAPTHTLTTELTLSRVSLGVKRDASSTRARLTARAVFTLIARDGGHRRFTVMRTSSYNQTESSYATLVAEQDATRRSLREIAEDAKRQLALLLRDPQPIGVKAAAVRPDA